MTLTMDSAQLRKLPRGSLQAVAKREAVRAIGKSEDIISRLIQKYPGGVPVQEDGDRPSVSSAPPPKIVLKISSKGTSFSVIPRSPGDHADSKDEGKAASEEAAPLSPSSSTEALELLYPDDYDASPANTGPESALTPHPEVAESEVRPGRPASPPGESLPAPRSEHSSLQAHDTGRDATSGATPDKTSNHNGQADVDGANDAEDADGAAETYVDPDYPKGAPTHYMVVDALRAFTPLANAIPSMEARVAESRCLLQRTESVLEKKLLEARELTVTREYAETFVLGKMKDKRELFDGTAKLNKADRKLRMKWLHSERNAENERRWKETNALYEKKGLKPEPFSAFASQSDEEEIESLQTTPPSSQNGNSKRAREPSVDGESGDADGDSDIERESKRRKRARS